MDSEPDIALTAALVNESRSRREDLSRDRYARLWVTGQSRQQWDAFSREVYPLDDIELSLRNRFFLERISEFMASTPGGRLVKYWSRPIHWADERCGYPE